MTLPAATDVVIVGAGPTGLTLACQLAARGVDFVLIDRAPAGANESRAAVVHARTLEVLEPLGVTDALRAAGIIATRFTARDHGRKLITLRLDGLPTAYPYMLMIPQSATEAILAQRLQALGGTIHRSVALTGLRREGPEVTITAEAADGTSSDIRGRYVVGCDGMHSSVREFAAIPFEGGAYPESFVLADVLMDWQSPDEEGCLFLAPDGLMVVVPLPGGHYRIVASMESAPEHPSRDDIQALMDKRGPSGGSSVQITDVTWSSRFRVHHRLARHYRNGPIFIAGDAAHVHSPAGGQGMNTGIQDAQYLGARLADVLIDGAGEDLLDDYERVRRPIAEAVVNLTDRITRAVTVQSPWRRHLRNAVIRTATRIPPLRRQIAMRVAGLTTRQTPTRHAPSLRRRQ